MIKGALEDNILTLIVWSPEHSPALAMQLSADLFSSRSYRDVAGKAFEHIERYGQPPGAHIRDLFEGRLRGGEDGQLLARTFDAMEELYPTIQASYVLAELDKFVTLRKLGQAVETAADALAAGDIDAARAALYVPDAQPATSKGIYLSDPDEALRFLTERDEDHFTSGIGLLDDMGIKPERKAVMILIAPPKRGKSWFLVQCGRDNMLGRKKVLHVTLEMSEDRVSKRYVQSLYAMTSSKTETIRVPVFKRDEAGRSLGIDFETLNPEGVSLETRAKVARKLRRLKQRAPLKIKEFPTGQLTLAQLNSYLDYLARAEGFVPDMLMVDYPNLMSMDVARLRVELGKTFQGLRGICVARNMAGVFVTQGNRISSSSKVVGANQVGEDYSIIGTADYVLTYSQTGQERQMGLARILVAAGRNEKDQFITLVGQSYATGQFCLDSVYMQKHMEAEMRRLTGDDEDAADD